MAQKMGPFPAGAGAKAPWPPPLDPPLRRINITDKGIKEERRQEPM